MFQIIEQTVFVPFTLRCYVIQNASKFSLHLKRLHDAYMSHNVRGHSSMEKSINTINVTLADSLHLQYITLLRRLLGLMSNKTSRLIPPMNGEKTTNILASKTRYFCLNSKLCVC